MIIKGLKHHLEIIIFWIYRKTVRKTLCLTSFSGLHAKELFLSQLHQGIQQNVFGAVGINGERGELFQAPANLHDYSAKIRALKCVQFFKENDNGGALFNATPQKDPSHQAF